MRARRPKVIVYWGGKRRGAGRPLKTAAAPKTALLQVTVLSETLSTIDKSAFDLGVSRGQVIDQKFTEKPQQTIKSK